MLAMAHFLTHVWFGVLAALFCAVSSVAFGMLGAYITTKVTGHKIRRGHDGGIVQGVVIVISALGIVNACLGLLLGLVTGSWHAIVIGCVFSGVIGGVVLAFLAIHI